MIPSLFISHGAPNRFMSQSPAKEFLESLTNIIETPRAIIIFSAHWFSKDIEITLNKTSEAERGCVQSFSDPYDVKYQTDQPKWFSDRMITLLQNNNLKYSISDRALDHGAWSVLMLSYPNADVPVIGISLPVYNDLVDYWFWQRNPQLRRTKQQ